VAFCMAENLPDFSVRRKHLPKAGRVR